MVQRLIESSRASLGIPLPGETALLIGQAGALLALFAALVVVVVVGVRWLSRHGAEIQKWFVGMVQRVGRSPFVQRVRRRYPGAWAFIGRRFAGGEYLGLHLTAGLLLSLGALWLFGGIAEDVIHHDPLTRFDITVADALHRHAFPAMVELAKGVTLLGSPIFVGAWSLGVAVLLLVRKEHLALGGWVAALVGGSLLDAALKATFHRARPTWDHPLLRAAGWSFPSGHAMGSLIAYGMLAYLLMRHDEHPRRRMVIIGCALLLVLLIGLSRMYLGVHYFSDVIGGYAAGTVWLATCISGLEVLRRRPAGVGSGTHSALRNPP